MRRHALCESISSSLLKSAKEAQKGGRVRKTALVFVIMAMALVVGGGTALAATIGCNGGVCEGTDRADTLNGSPERDGQHP